MIDFVIELLMVKRLLANWPANVGFYWQTKKWKKGKFGKTGKTWVILDVNIMLKGFHTNKP